VVLVCHCFFPKLVASFSLQTGPALVTCSKLSSCLHNDVQSQRTSCQQHINLTERCCYMYQNGYWYSDTAFD